MALCNLTILGTYSSGAVCYLTVMSEVQVIEFGQRSMNDYGAMVE